VIIRDIDLTQSHDVQNKNLGLIYCAFAVGIITGTVGSLFRLSLAYIEDFRNVLFAGAGVPGLFSWLWPFVFSIVGISAALLITRKYAPEAAGSGIQEIEGALDKTRPMRWRRVLPVKFVASLLSMGSGLLLGREGPTVQIGANLGKMTNDIFTRPGDDANTLVSAGAAAGLASAFNAPLSGIIFVIEEMHGHFKFNLYAVSAIMIAAGTADYIVRLIVGPDPVMKMTVFQSPALATLWLFIILGVLFAFVGWLFNKLLVSTMDFFAKFTKRELIIAGIIAGLIVAAVGMLNPQMIGGGYDTIRTVLDQSLTLQSLIVIFAVRLFLTIFSYGTGVPGGIFTPLLTLGVALGMFFGIVAQNYFPELIPHPGVFAVAGMAGIFAATVRAPITGLVLAVEMTANYELILPLIIITVTASLMTAQLGNEPIYTTLLKRTLDKQANRGKA